MTLPGNPLPEPSHETITPPRKRPPIRTGPKRCVRVFMPTIGDEYPEPELRASALAEAEEFARAAFFGIRPKPKISHNRTPTGKIIAVVTWKNPFN